MSLFDNHSIIKLKQYMGRSGRVGRTNRAISSHNLIGSIETCYGCFISNLPDCWNVNGDTMHNRVRICYEHLSLNEIPRHELQNYFCESCQKCVSSFDELACKCDRKTVLCCRMEKLSKS